MILLGSLVIITFFSSSTLPVSLRKELRIETIAISCMALYVIINYEVNFKLEVKKLLSVE